MRCCIRLFWEHRSIYRSILNPEPKGSKVPNHRVLRVGSCHNPCFGYLFFGLGSYRCKVGYPKQRVWYESTGM